ncbi:hypothetical protein [Fodinicurvata sp. EGI_FJ10296]|uniref:hypothetical protein n=1 Tax=Fodinicurvata sp. EGI_FJ10296 TaxID=3231908 RepID=UPI003453FC03
MPWLPDLPVITSGQLFIGAWASFAVLFIGNRQGQPPRVPIWAGLLVGAATAVLLPLFPDSVTGSYQRASLRAHVRRGGRKASTVSKPHKTAHRRVNPKTGSLFP